MPSATTSGSRTAGVCEPTWCPLSPAWSGRGRQRLENLGMGRTAHDDLRGGAFLHAAETVVDDRVRARHFCRKLDRRCPAGGDMRGLDIRFWRTRQRPFWVDPVEDRSDHVKTRGEVGTSDAEENANRVSDLRVQRVV